VIAAVATVTGIVLAAYGSIGLLLFVALATACFHLLYSKGASYSAVMLRAVFARFFHLPAVLILSVGLLLSVGISVLAGALVYYAASLNWNGISYVVVLWAFWFLILVVGHVVFEAAAQIVAHVYFTHDSAVATIGRALPRAFGRNLGVAGFDSLLLPFFQPFYFWAKLDPLDLRARLSALPETVAVVITNVFEVVHTIAVSVCGTLDRELTYPSERGAIYSALFGISRAEGCRRVAELDVKVYADLIGASCFVDQILGFAADVLEIATAIVGWVAAGRIGEALDEQPRLELKRVGAALGFFVAFAVLHIVRTFVRAVIETLFVCFYELPEQMAQFSPEVDACLRKEYEDAVQRKIVIAAQRSEVALLSRETLG
jgi:hypothetical protein